MRKNLYINEGEVKREGNTLKINGVKIPLSVVDNVFLFDKVKMSDGVRNFLLRNKRVIVYMNGRYEFLGILLPEFLRSDMANRIWQYENRDNIECAKVIVKKKIEAIEKHIGVNLDMVKVRLKEVNRLKEVLGIEGNVSRMMFESFKNELRKRGIDEFVKRAYNPPPDRINGLLGFLYTLYYAYAFCEVIGAGFDPYIGFLHQKRGTHAVFASDVMEEARVELTFLALKILDKVYPHMFEERYLTLDGRREVLREFDRFVGEYENGILKHFKERGC
jgi:CRISPR-associated protein Cas1